MFILFVKKGQIIIFNFELWFNPSLYEKRVIFFSITIISNTCIYQKVGLSWNLHWLFCMCVWLSTISPARRNFFQLKNFQIVCCSFITVGKILIWDSTVFYQILRLFYLICIIRRASILIWIFMRLKRTRWFLPDDLFCVIIIIHLFHFIFNFLFKKLCLKTCLLKPIFNEKYKF